MCVGGEGEERRGGVRVFFLWPSGQICTPIDLLKKCVGTTPLLSFRWRGKNKQKETPL